MKCIFCNEECEDQDGHNMRCYPCNCHYFISNKLSTILDIYIHHNQHILTLMIDHRKIILYEKRNTRILELPYLLWAFPTNKQAVIKRLLDMRAFV